MKKPGANPISYKKMVLLMSATLITAIYCGTVLGETYYKWKNESGNWVYGELPPVGVEAIKVKTTGGPSRRSQEPRPELANQEELNPVNKEMCQKAKANLNTLNSGAIIQRQDENGQSVTLSPEEREVERDKAQSAINRFCLGMK